MTSLSPEQQRRRERTLMAAVLLSMWGPLVTGIAVVLSQSLTQVADFVRRTVELAALVVSWRVFRYLYGQDAGGSERRAHLEKMASYSVAAALVCSGMVMFILAGSNWRNYEPGGNVYPGLAVAVLGLLTNTWFWRRYTVLLREQYGSLISSQRRLYGSKALVDVCVIVALGAVALFPAHEGTGLVDSLGSLVVGIYLLYSGWRTAESARTGCIAGGRETEDRGSAGSDSWHNSINPDDKEEQNDTVFYETPGAGATHRISGYSPRRGLVRHLAGKHAVLQYSRCLPGHSGGFLVRQRGRPGG